jgi:hypothetical protein
MIIACEALTSKGGARGVKSTEQDTSDVGDRTYSIHEAYNHKEDKLVRRRMSEVRHKSYAGRVFVGVSLYSPVA